MATNLSLHSGYRRTLEYLGVTLILCGSSLAVLGIVDLVWTSFYYRTAGENCPTDWPVELDPPCENGVLVWTWIGAGLWGGVVIVFVGALGFRLHLPLKNPRGYVMLYSVACFLLVFPVSPAVITLSALQIYYNKDIFYLMDGGSLEFGDEAKFIIPLITALVAFLALMIALPAAALGCRVNGNQGLVSGKSAALLPQVATQPLVLAPQQYEVVEIPQAAPPAYWVGPYPLGGAPYTGGFAPAPYY